MPSISESKINNLKKYSKAVLQEKTIKFSDLKPSKISTDAGVYIIYNKNNKIVYIGESKNLRRRLYQDHLMGDKISSTLKKKIMRTREISRKKAKEHMKNNFKVKCKVLPISKTKSTEHFLIAIFNPKYND